MKSLVISVAVALLVGCQGRITESSTSSSSSSSNPSSLEGGMAASSTAKVSLAQVKTFVDQVLKDKADKSAFYSFEGSCLDISVNWIPEFEQAKLPAVLQQTQAVHYFTVGSKKELHSPTHFFIAFNPQTEDEIIVDPTYGQFIDGAKNLGLPLVLVAKTTELKTIYAEYARYLKVDVAYDPSKGLYSPEEFVGVIYSTPAFSKYRTSLTP